MTDVLVRLEEALGPGSVVSDPELLARYSADVTGRFTGSPMGAVRPATAEEVAAVLRICGLHRVGVVPQGGNTGLVGGAIASSGEVVLSLERFTELAAIDEGTSSVVAGAGVTLEALQQHARSNGLDFPIDFAARGSATVGGMIATDAGGSLVLRYGTMRDRVDGLHVVFGDGTIVDHLDRPAKDSSGFDITRLVPASEGTLAIVVAARLSLVPLLSKRCVALLGMQSLAAGVEFTVRLRDRLPSLEAVDFFTAEGLALVTRHTGLPRPFAAEAPAYLVVSCAADEDPTGDLAAVVDRAAEVTDVLVAQSAEQSARLWSYRESHNASINAAGIPHKLDVAVPPDSVPELVGAVRRVVEAIHPDALVIVYGHLADGNVHINVLGPPPDDERIDEAILRLVAEMGGSISAEHGVGRAKARWLGLGRSTDDIKAMRRIKAALDPHDILNPGKLLASDA